MSCEGLTGQKLKDCQAKAKIDKAAESDKKTNAEKAKERAEKLKKATTDLSTFKNKDVVKWERKPNGERRTTGAGKLAFGGTSLGKTKTRMARRKNGKSYRA
jgi:hypothetical protein